MPHLVSCTPLRLSRPPVLGIAKIIGNCHWQRFIGCDAVRSPNPLRDPEYESDFGRCDFISIPHPLIRPCQQLPALRDHFKSHFGVIAILEMGHLGVLCPRTPLADVSRRDSWETPSVRAQNTCSIPLCM